MSTTTICCILANDAVTECGAYQKAGSNYTVRCQAAIEWQLGSRQNDTCIWVFAAGTGLDARAGPTLGTVCAQMFLEMYPCDSPETWVNSHGRAFYGTYEEIEWLVRHARTAGHAPEDVEFVFFTQPQHLSRVKLIWRLFYRTTWGGATFIETPHAPGHELQDSSEWLKVVALYTRRYLGRPAPNHTVSKWQ